MKLVIATLFCSTKRDGKLQANLVHGVSPARTLERDAMALAKKGRYIEIFVYLEIVSAVKQ